jgi:hypothetical protein
VEKARHSVLVRRIEDGAVRGLSELKNFLRRHSRMKPPEGFGVVWAELEAQLRRELPCNDTIIPY